MKYDVLPAYTSITLTCWRFVMKQAAQEIYYLRATIIKLNIIIVSVVVVVRGVRSWSELQRLERQRVPLTVGDQTESDARRHRKRRAGRGIDGALQRQTRTLTPRIAHADHVPAAVARPQGQTDGAPRRAGLCRRDGGSQPATLLGRERRMTRLVRTLRTTHLYRYTR